MECSSSSCKKIILLKSRISQLGGLEKYTCRLGRAFFDLGCDVTLLTTESSDERVRSCFSKVVSFPVYNKLSARAIKLFDRAASKWLIDGKKDKKTVIFGMDRNCFQTHLRAGNGVHAAYLHHRAQQDSLFKRTTYRFNPLHNLLLKIEKESFEHPDLEMLYTNSNMVRSEILNHYTTDPKKIRVIHNGVEWMEMQEHFALWPDLKQQILKRLNLSPDIFHFVFVGHNYRRKGLEPLLRGLSLIRKEDFHLSVIGKDKNWQDFELLAKKWGLIEKVSFLGVQTDMNPFYSLADALVIPSFYDPFANVTVEALAMGVFIVSSKTNGAVEILNEKNGCVIESLLSPDAVARALKEALQRKKTEKSAQLIRDSVRHLDFSNQLPELTSCILPCL